MKSVAAVQPLNKLEGIVVNDVQLMNAELKLVTAVQPLNKPEGIVVNDVQLENTALKLVTAVQPVIAVLISLRLEHPLNPYIIYVNPISPHWIIFVILVLETPAPDVLEVNDHPGNLPLILIW